MLRSKRGRSPHKKKPQKDDTSFKSWVEQQAQDIVPFVMQEQKGENCNVEKVT